LRLISEHGGLVHLQSKGLSLRSTICWHSSADQSQFLSCRRRTNCHGLRRVVHVVRHCLVAWHHVGQKLVLIPGQYLRLPGHMHRTLWSGHRMMHGTLMSCWYVGHGRNLHSTRCCSKAHVRRRCACKRDLLHERMTPHTERCRVHHASHRLKVSMACPHCRSLSRLRSLSHWCGYAMAIIAGVTCGRKIPHQTTP